MRKINLPVLALIAANIAWGAGTPIMKFTLEQVPPFSLAFMRFLFASLIFYPFVHERISLSDLKNKWLWLFALSGITFNIVFFFLALQRTSSINAPVIASTGPIMVLIASAIFLREKPGPAAIIGTLLSLLGISVIIFQPLLQTGLDGEIVGNLFLVLATVGAVISTITGRKILTGQNALAITFWSCLIGTVSFLPLMLKEYVVDPGWIANTQVSGWAGVIYGILFSSTLAYAASDWALGRLQAYKVSIFAYIDPIAAIIVAIPLLGEKITAPFVFGSLLIFMGIFVAEKRIHWHPIHKLLKT